MEDERELRFDPKAFVAIAGRGRTISRYRNNQVVFSLGEVADSVFYVSEGRSNSLSCPSRGRKPLSQFWGRISSAEKVVSPGNRAAWLQPSR